MNLQIHQLSHFRVDLDRINDLARLNIVADEEYRCKLGDHVHLNNVMFSLLTSREYLQDTLILDHLVKITLFV